VQVFVILCNFHVLEICVSESNYTIKLVINNFLLISVFSYEHHLNVRGPRKIVPVFEPVHET
jgi:hypothetical protein